MTIYAGQVLSPHMQTPSQDVVMSLDQAITGWIDENGTPLTLDGLVRLW